MMSLSYKYPLILSDGSKCVNPCNKRQVELLLTGVHFRYTGLYRQTLVGGKWHTRVIKI